MHAANKSITQLTAADLMSREVTVIPRHLSLRSTARLLSHAHVTGAPVIDSGGACVGVISSTDFVHWASGRPAPRCDAPHAACACSDWQIYEPESLPTEEVGNFMTADPVFASPTTTVRDLARMMIDARIHRVVIVDKEKRPVGIVSTTDILAAVAAST